MKVTVRADFNVVVNRLRQALIAGNFDILVDTNVQSLIKDRDHLLVHPYWIFSVYRADLVARGMVVTPENTLLVHHTLTVGQVDDQISEILSIDPRFVAETIGNPYLTTIAEELYRSLHRVMEAVAQ
jgi:hypothetical protein